MKDLNMCDDQICQNINNTYDTKIIEKYINQVLLNNVDNNVDLFVFFNKWYDNLSKDSQMRKEISEFLLLSKKK